MKISLLLYLLNQYTATTHVINHSHQDLGWIKTIDEYYNDQVREIFDSVFHSLKKHHRKFVISDIYFLKMYLLEGNKDKKIHKIKKFIRRKQLEFVNGGIAMADSACTYFEDIVNNFHYGMLLTHRLFGKISKVGW